MRTAIVILALALSACTTAETYEANYDALARARAECLAEGGELELKPMGDPYRLSAYGCVRK